MEYQPLEYLLAQQLRALRWSLSLAESCTGGFISHRITNVPGASEYFFGGIVAYSNSAKHHLLGVSQATLKQFGAVSEQTVLEMARGGQKIFGTQVAIAVSGIAGPGGASPQKPLGTVWIAVAVLDRSDAYHYRFFGTREQIKYQSAESALWLLVRALSRELNEPTLLHQVSALQPLAVEFREQGTNPPQPLAFYWKGERLAIASVGRRWQDSAGEHYLALTYQEKVFELIRRADGCWYLRAPQEALGLA